MTVPQFRTARELTIAQTVIQGEIVVWSAERFLPRGTTVHHHVMADGICGYWRAHQRTGHTFNGGVERNCRFRLFTLKRQNTLIWRWLRFLIRSDLKNWSKLPKFTHSKLGIRKSSRESESGHAHYKLQHCRSSDNVSFKFIGPVSSELLGLKWVFRFLLRLLLPLLLLPPPPTPLPPPPLLRSQTHTASRM